MIELDKYLTVNVYITPKELKQLEKLVSNYPWFSLAHQLVFIGCVQNDYVTLTDKSKQAAIYTLSRKRLYGYVKKTTQQKPIGKNIQILNNKTDIASKTTSNEIDDLLLNFSNEYFSVEDLPPIDVTEHEDETNDMLISRFINENPRIIPKSSSVSNLDNLIQIDEDLDDEPASETLAEIYISQGLYDQAISTYEKLILLNPKKSVYFASLIDELKAKRG